MYYIFDIYLKELENILDILPIYLKLELRPCSLFSIGCLLVAAWVHGG